MACKRSAVRSRLPPPARRESCSGSPSSRGLGHRPFTAITGVRIPVGTPEFLAGQCKLSGARKRGVVVQLVRIPACHAGGRGFESRPLRQRIRKGQSKDWPFLFLRARSGIARNSASPAGPDGSFRAQGRSGRRRTRLRRCRRCCPCRSSRRSPSASPVPRGRCGDSLRGCCA